MQLPKDFCQPRQCTAQIMHPLHLLGLGYTVLLDGIAKRATVCKMRDGMPGVNMAVRISSDRGEAKSSLLHPTQSHFSPKECTNAIFSRYFSSRLCIVVPGLSRIHRSFSVYFIVFAPCCVCLRFIAPESSRDPFQFGHGFINLLAVKFHAQQRSTAPYTNAIETHQVQCLPQSQ